MADALKSGECGVAGGEKSELIPPPLATHHSPHTTPDEFELRTPGFRPGVAVVLADGCAWQLPKPMVRFTPDDAHESGFQVRLSLAGDAGNAAWTKALALHEAADAGPDLVRAELALGRALLLANYALTPERLAAVLQFGYDDDDAEGCRIRAEVLAVAGGLGPKP
jgi:hypothetical protein